ncbi:MAG: hypothetical protein IKK33_09620 [Lachnospiraceae bacterium]|nr:hypothetical protein [Lachnospiraceae bacterium]
MKANKLKFTLLILIFMLGISGCNSSTKDTTKGRDKDRTPDTTIEATAEPTEEPTPEPTEEPTPEPTEKPTPEPTEEPTPEPTEEPTGDIPDDIDPSAEAEANFFDYLAQVAEEKNAEDLMAEVNKFTGYISSDADTVDELLELCELDVEWLSHENIDNGTEDTFYRFEMTHEYPLMEIPSDTGMTYMTEIVLDEESFYLMFGAKEDPSDIEILTEEGITIEYWNLAIKKDDNYLLVPLFAGNEDNGYYIVRTNCDMSDFNMSDTMSLAEQGITFTTNSSIIMDDPEPNTGTPAIDVPAPLLSTDDFSFEITEVVIEEGLSALYCELENGYSKEVYLNDENILLNGEDITDYTLFTFWIEGNSSLTQSFVITDYTLSSGDTLQISFTVVDYETDTLLGTVEYSYTVS